MKILMSNIGYALGINGALAHHMRYAHRHFYCSPAAQEHTLKQISCLINQEDPDICCFVEIDQGSLNSGNFNQLAALADARYGFSVIENKYGTESRLRTLALTRGKSNAFMAKNDYPHEKIYFTHGVKRLIYKITLAPGITLFFAHFSLKKPVRTLQLQQVKELIRETPGEVLFLGDFNILEGLQELAPLIQQDNLILLNRDDSPTFTFHRRRLILDICLCSPGLAQKASLRVIPQPYSDHAALLVEIAE